MPPHSPPRSSAPASATPSTSPGCAGCATSLLDSGAYADDSRQQRWLAAAGFEQTRTWLQMTRPVTADEASTLPAPREGVSVRPVERHDDGLPVAQDLQDVHRVLEESFQDHFSSYRESFPEFVMRLREDPGHRWDHWWLATVETDEGVLPAGALVSTVLREDAAGFEGSYVDYIGVHRRARGRGVAKALLHTAIADAARRVATASASRSTPTHRPVPTGSTRRWAGSPTTAPSPGTASSTCADRRRASAREDVDHEPGRVRQHG